MSEKEHLQRVQSVRAELKTVIDTELSQRLKLLNDSEVGRLVDGLKLLETLERRITHGIGAG